MQVEMFQRKPWIGVDLDGTLAFWRGHWDGQSVDDIGEPVPLMMERVKAWIAVGLTVKIFTARAANPELIPPVREWLVRHGIGELEITNAKDMNMVELWDDRAVHVVRNTGIGIRPQY